MSSIELYSMAHSMLSYSLGVAIGSTLLDKIGHVAEFLLNTLKGDYSNPCKLADGRIIVSMPVNEQYSGLRNILITPIYIALIQEIAKKIPAHVLAYPQTFMLGISTAPAFYGMYHLQTTRDTYGKTWVVISNENAQRNGIDIDHVPALAQKATVYETPGFAPRNII